MAQLITLVIVLYTLSFTGLIIGLIGIIYNAVECVDSDKIKYHLYSTIPFVMGVILLFISVVIQQSMALKF